MVVVVVVVVVMPSAAAAAAAVTLPPESSLELPLRSRMPRDASPSPSNEERIGVGGGEEIVPDAEGGPRRRPAELGRRVAKRAAEKVSSRRMSSSLARLRKPPKDNPGGSTSMTRRHSPHRTSDIAVWVAQWPLR